MRLAALLLVAATAAGAEIPVGNPPLIGGSVDGLVFDGSHFVLLQHGLRTSLADDGTPLVSSDDGDRVALASSGRGTLSVSISGGNAYANELPLGPADAVAAAWDGTHYAVAWRDSGRLRLEFLSDNGDISAPIDIASDVVSFALAARDGTTLVAWSAAGALFARTAAGAAVRIGDGVVSDVAAGRDGFLVTTLSAGMLVAQHLDVSGHPDASYTIAPAAHGARVARERYAYALVWPDGNALLGERIDPFGGTMHGPFVAAALDREIDSAAIAATGATTLVAYASALGTFAKPIDDTAPGKPLPEHRARQSAVHAAGAFVVWQQETAGGSEVRVDDHVAAAGTLEHVVAGNGGALIVYRDASGIWSLSWPAAAPPSRFPFDILGPDQQVASNGSESLRVWNDGGAIVAELLGGGERIVVDGSPAQKGTPHVRWDGAAWIVSWPEIVDASTAGFASMRIGGAKTIVATAAMPISLTDWSGAADAIYYVRGGRLFLQRFDAPRRRAAGR